MKSNKESVTVWDPLIRVGHWALVIAFFTTYLTEDDFMPTHVWAGYVVGGYLVLRIVWGFVGGKYARFNHFVYSLAKIADYLKNLIARKPQYYTGIDCNQFVTPGDLPSKWCDQILSEAQAI